MLSRSGDLQWQSWTWRWTQKFGGKEKMWKKPTNLPRSSRREIAGLPRRRSQLVQFSDKERDDETSGMHPSKDDPQRPGRLRELAVPEATMWRAWLWWWVTCVLVKRNVKKILHGWCNHCLWQQECGGEYCTSFTAAGTVKSRLKFHEKGLESTVAIARKVIHLTNGAVSSVYSGW